MTEKDSKWQRKGQGRDLAGIGWLEADILHIVWDKQRVTVRDVYEELRLRRRIAYTTVLSVLRNLAAKELLHQNKSHAAYVYTALVSDVDVARAILETLVDRVMGGNTKPLIAHLEGMAPEREVLVL